jgi:DNA-binding NarL/FixJ family response regulator
MAALRVVIADDAAILREGLALVLVEAGLEVTRTVSTGDELVRAVRLDRPDVAVVDIRMPPTHTDEGIAAATTIRASYPDTSVLVLSQYVETAYAVRLFETNPSHVGYLLKERVSDVASLADAVQRVHMGECVLDAEIVRRLVQRPVAASAIAELSPRERDVLALMAQGRSNLAIAHQLHLADKSVEANVRRIFQRLGLQESAADHRRVLAVLSYLRALD